MKNHAVRGFAIAAGLATAIFAQNNQQRQAAITGGGGPDRGKCTIEVVVDGTAQVEVRGNTAILRTINGQPAQWRRFQCDGQMPQNPPNFRFTGVDGRGRQNLVRQPGQGGAAVVEIQDPDGGSEGYTFDLTWDSRGAYNNSVVVPPVNRGPDPGRPVDRNDRPNDGYDERYDRNPRPNWRDSDYYRRYGHPFGVEEAVRMCQDSIVADATRRFRVGPEDVHFRRTSVDDQPGRNDWVIGTVDIHRARGGREELYGFQCSVNFDSGRIRTATMDPRPLPDRR